MRCKSRWIWDSHLRHFYVFEKKNQELPKTRELVCGKGLGQLPGAFDHPAACPWSDHVQDVHSLESWKWSMTTGKTMFHVNDCGRDGLFFFEPVYLALNGMPPVTPSQMVRFRRTCPSLGHPQRSMSFALMPDGPTDIRRQTLSHTQTKGSQVAQVQTTYLRSRPCLCPT